MIVRFVVTCVFFLAFFVARSQGADAPGQSDRIAALEKRVSELQKNVDRLTNTVEVLTGVTEKAATAEELRALQDKVDTLSELVKKVNVKQEEGIAKLRQGLREVEGIVSSISEDDGSGNQILALNNTMKTTRGREEVTEVVHQAMKHHGTLRIRNTMAFEQRVAVNRREYRIRPGDILVLSGVPVGTIALELVGWEPPRNWTIAPPNYEESIDIVPRSPAPRVIYSEPPLIPMR